MKKTIDQRTCDQCKKTVEQSTIQFGGSPFSGWVEVDRVGGTSLNELGKDRGPWDFCCPECAIRFLSSLDLGADSFVGEAT